MSEPAEEAKSTNLSLNGLEQVFEVDTTVIEGSANPDRRVPTRGLNIKEASQHYGLAIPTIRLKIKTGDIPAVKIDGPKGPEWRIFPDGLQDAPPPGRDTSGFSDIDNTVIEASYEADITLSEGLHQANINVASLIKANQDLISKLEAATYRNGYLEAQIESEKQQVKLLTDQLHKPAGWWPRFCSWMAGTKL